MNPKSKNSWSYNGWLSWIMSLSIFFALSFVPIVVRAAGTPGSPIVINMTTVSSSGSGYTYASNVLTITENGYYEITGTTTTKRIAVAEGLNDVNITLNNCSITTTTSGACVFSINSSVTKNTTVHLTLAGNNTLTSGATKAGLNVSQYSALTIDGDGKLTANGGSGTNQYGAGAGIGSNGNRNSGQIEINNCGAITINSGVIIANGGNGVGSNAGGGAGIGGGGGNGGIGGITYGAIIINGGDIRAIGGTYGGGSGGGSGAGIGGGGAGHQAANGGDNGGGIEVNGGKVYAEGGSGGAYCGGAGIGGGGALGSGTGKGGNGGDIDIDYDNAAVTTVGGGSTSGCIAPGVGSGGQSCSSSPTSVEIIKEPPVEITVEDSNEINDALTVVAKIIPSGVPKYQWYKNTTNSNTGGTLIPGATSGTLYITETLKSGKYFYYCVVSDECGNATTTTSIITAVMVGPQDAFTVTVSSIGTDATGSGDYLTGEMVHIYAGTPQLGQIFSHWTSGSGVTFANANSATTTFAMPASDVTVTAVFLNIYTVSFKDWDSTLLKTETVIHGFSATAPANPERAGYDFAGWDMVYDEVTSNLTVVALYTIKSYPVTFKDWNGTVLKTETVKHGSPATAPAEPERTNYTFIGWDKIFNNITGEMIVTAQYAINTYTVIFEDWDGTTIGIPQTVDHGSSATAPADPERGGYDFAGWDVAFDNITGNKTVKALYTIKTYTVTFEDWDDAELKCETLVKHGYSATAPDDPTRSGYTFTGWNKAFDNITGNLTVTAVYEINTYIVSFWDWDDTVLKTETVNHGSHATAPSEPSRAGYNFVGWDQAFDNVTGALNVTALYEIIFYTVIFEDWNGTELRTETVKYGSPATAPTDPKRDDYTFIGWDIVFDYVSDNMTVTALYELNPYTVIFKDWDGTELKSEIVSHGLGATAPASPIRTGYDFAGWDVTFSSVTGNMTVMALYAIKTYTIIFEDYDGTELKTEDIEYGSSAIPPANPKRTGYTFTGWDKDFSNVTGALTITALYELNVYEVIFKDWDGTELKKELVNHDSPATEPTEPTREGYTFTGWDAAFSKVTGNLTVTAMYHYNIYTVEFKDWNGAVLKTENVYHGFGATAPSKPIREGYTFYGWNAAFDNVTGNLTVTAQYTIKSYTVTFVDWDDTVLKTETVEHGADATAPASPARDDYNFASWDKLYNNVTENITVKAQYAIKTYNVTVSSTGTGKSGDGAYEAGVTVSIVAGTPPVGQRFRNWTTEYPEPIFADANDPTTTFNMPKENITVTANFVNIYMVTVINEGSGVTYSEYYEAGETVSVSAGTHAGKRFVKWTVTAGAVIFANANNPTTTFIMPANAVTVTAEFADVFTVTVLSAGAGMSGSGDYEAGEIVCVNAGEPSIDQLFVDWTVEHGTVTLDDAGMKITCFTMPAEDVTVKANFTPTCYVSVVSEGAGSGGSGDYAAGEIVHINAGTPLPGKRFTHWTTISSLTFNDENAASTSFTMIASIVTVTVTAHFIDIFTVTFKDWDGTVLKTETVDDGSPATAPAEPTRTGYTFSHWDKAFNNITGDLTVTAEYTIISYTVTFKDWDGTVLQSGSVNYNSPATAPAEPSRTGYTFSGWDKAFGNITDELTVTAQYTINVYTVTFVDWNDVVLGTETVVYGFGATAPADPSRTGYTFTGWDEDFDNITGHLTVKAQYIINSYTVIFIDWDGTTIGIPQTINHGSAAIEPASPTRTGYTFVKWDKASDNITGDIVVTAEYEMNIYTIIFEDWDGSELKKETVNHGYPATAPDNPSRTGYTFTGWDKEFNEITGHLTVTAEYAINSYKVTFIDWDGDNVLKIQFVDYDLSATAPVSPERTGYTFTGWDKAFDKITGDLIVTAEYKINTYTVIFEDWDGTELKKEITIKHGSSATAPAHPKRGNYTFSGWDKDFDEITGHLTVTALYDINTYKVTFKNWDGTTIGTPQIIEHGSAATEPAEPTREGYDFTGWDALSDNVTGNMTITAQYTIKNYTVTFADWNDSTIGAPQTVNHGSSAIAPPNPMRVSHTFTGWDKDYSNITGALTVKALYEINTYTVTFKDWNGATIGFPQTVDHGSAATKPANPMRTGYDFTGWDAETDIVTGNMTVTAQYKIKIFEVTFNNWNGTKIKSEFVNHGSSATAPPNPTRPNYTFTGWDALFNNITGDMTVTALFTINTYTVIFKDWNGIILKTETVDHYSAATAPAEPSREGYDFFGWDETLVNVTGNMTITALYTIITYTVTFKDWNGTVLKTETVKHGYSATAPENPMRDGFYLTGWNLPFVDVTSDMTITALYAFITYPVTVLSPGTGKSGDGDYAENEFVTIDAGATPAGQRFRNWTSDDGVTFANANSATTSFIMPAIPATVTANFEVIYEVIVLSAGTGSSGSGYYAAGETVIINAGTPAAGQAFSGWITTNSSVIFADDTNLTTTFIMPDEDVTVKADFYPKYTVTVISMGTGFSGDGEYAAGEIVNIDAGTMPAGQRFKNWTTSDGVVFDNANSATATFTMPAIPVTVTANLEAIYEVTVLSAGTGSSGSGYYAAGKTVNINAGTPAVGQIFLGWITTSAGVIFADNSNLITSFIMPDGDVTVKADFYPKFAVTVISTGTGSGGNGDYAPGEIVGIEAGTAPDGKRFKEWTVTEGAITLDDPGSESTFFIMPSEAVKVTAVFEDVFEVIVVSEATDATGGGDYTANETVNISAGTPPSGKRFSHWTASPSMTFDDDNASSTFFRMPANAVTVTAVFQSIQPVSVEIIVDKLTAQRNGNSFYINSECGNTQSTITVVADPAAIVEINGVVKNPQIVDLLNYGDNIFNIRVSEQGHSQTYTLVVVRYYQESYEYPNVPSINCNMQTNGGYIFTDFQWYREDAPVGGAIKPYFQIKDDAVYYGEITLSDGRKWRTCDIRAQHQDVLLKAFPNPTQGQITVSNEPFSVDRIQVFDIHGRLVLQPSTNPFNMSVLPDGVYVIKVNGGTIKVVVKK